MKSEVFDNYAKLMAEKGLLKTAEEETPAVKTRTDYDETIKMLYGLEIETNNSKEDILDQAHPEAVIIAPSYDKLNGLVENLKERHNIMVGIVNRPNTGKGISHHKYAAAYNDLLKELISIGFYTDSINKPEIMVKADECAQMLSKKAFVFPLVGALWSAKNYISLALGVKYVHDQIKAETTTIKESTSSILTSLKELYLASPSDELKQDIEFWFDKIKNVYKSYSLVLTLEPTELDPQNPQQAVGDIEKNKEQAEPIKNLEENIDQFINDFEGFIEKLELAADPELAGYSISEIAGWLKDEALEHTIGNNYNKAAEAGLDFLNDLVKLQESIKKGTAIAQNQTPNWKDRISGWLENMVS